MRRIQKKPNHKAEQHRKEFSQKGWRVRDTSPRWPEKVEISRRNRIVMTLGTTFRDGSGREAEKLATFRTLGKSAAYVAVLVQTCTPRVYRREPPIMSPPLCRYPGCSTQCSALSEAQRTRWSETEGESWGWQSKVSAYFFLCEPHHRQVWPQDLRSRNRSSRPGGSLLARAVRGNMARLVSGDLYLTVAPPEYLFSGAASGCPRPRTSSRSPRTRPAASVRLSGKRVSWADDKVEVFNTDDVDRTRVDFRQGPCDVCGAQHCHVVAGMLTSATYFQKETVFLCTRCRGMLYSTGHIYATELQETIVPVVRP